MPDFDAIGLEGALRSTTMVPSPDSMAARRYFLKILMTVRRENFSTISRSNVNRQFNLQQQEPEGGHPGSDR